MKKRIAALSLALVLGAVLGYFFADASNNGWFSARWRAIENPPEVVHQMVALNRDSLWIQGDSGTLFLNEASSSCKAGCWQGVSEVPSLPIVESHEVAVTAKTCAVSPPLSRVIDSLSECRRGMWIVRNYTFALRDDGTILLWQVDLSREWASALMFIGVCIGALALFIPTLVTVSFFALRDWLSKRQDRR
jgi:hypothetical protein